MSIDPIVMPWWGYLLVIAVSSIIGRYVGTADERRRQRDRAPYVATWECESCGMKARAGASEPAMSIQWVDALAASHTCTTKENQ